MTSRYLSAANRLTGGTRQPIRVGPFLSVVFEERQELWLRMKELSREARRAGADFSDEIGRHQRLMPEPGRWPAAVWLSHVGSRASETARIRRVIGETRLELVSASGHLLPARFPKPRNTARMAGLLGWVEFCLDPRQSHELANPDLRWQLRWRLVDKTYISTSFHRACDGSVIVSEELRAM